MGLCWATGIPLRGVPERPGGEFVWACEGHEVDDPRSFPAADHSTPLGWDMCAVRDFERRHWQRPAAVDAVDAGHVTFFSAAGLNLLLRWLRESEAEGRTVALARSARPLDRLLELTHLEGMFSRVERDK